MGSRLRCFICGFLFLLLLSPANGASHRNRLGARGHVCNTTEWGALNALGLQQQMELERKREARLLAQPQPLIAAADVGEIAVIPDDGTLVVRPNTFDLARRSVRFTPSGAGYRVTAGGPALDLAAASAGQRLLLDDDDTRQVQIGFSFPFFGRAFTSVFVNSDGNLTFTAGDVSTSERDLGRFLTGVPRISTFFNDLNPADGGQVTSLSESGRFVVTWTEVPECCAPPRQPISTFQVSLFPDGRIEFAYAEVGAAEAVVGISSGGFTGNPKLMDLSAADGSEAITVPVAEVFSTRTDLNITAAARKFYETHEDAYDHLVVFTNFSLQLQDAYAFAALIANNTSGIGLRTFNFSSEFGSAGRLGAMVFMENLGKYPPDPLQVVAEVAPNSTISVLGQEAGHHWLAFVAYPSGSTLRSPLLLGRDFAHWSFFFNTEASVMEGNEIRDNGDGSFITTDVVKRYSTLDQYVMGLRAPAEVQPSFVVTSPDLPLIDTTPRVGVSFRGTRLDVTVDRLIEANGPRLPAAAVAQKNYNFAFVLVTPTAQPASPEEIQKLDTIRRSWEEFWGQATGGRSRANTRLLRALSFSGLPAAVLQGGQVTARLRAGRTDPAARSFTLASSSSGVASVPTSVTIPANAQEIEFRVTASGPGVTRISASASGYDTADAAVSVVAAAAVQLTAVSGSGQVGAPSSTLSQPLVVLARDVNGLPVPGATVQFTATGGATVNPASATTDATGRAQTLVTLGSSGGRVTITATVAGATAAGATFTVTALAPATVPEGSAVNGASFARTSVSPGSIISIFGTNLSVDTLLATTTPLATTLGGVTVRVNDTPAPLYFVSPGQINAQMPFEISGSTATLTVNNGAGPSPAITVSLVPSSPGIFTLRGDGTGAAAALHTNFSLVTDSSPAQGGEVVLIYCTGLGPVSPAVPSGRPAPNSPLSTTSVTPQVTIGGQTAEVLFSGLAPGFVGLYQINARVPTGLPAGPQPLIIRGLGTMSQTTATLAIQ